MLINFLPLVVYQQLKKHHLFYANREYYDWVQNQKKVITIDSYSYKPFVDSKSLFVHIPKCAGVSISKGLYGNLAGGHTTLSGYLNAF